MPWKGGNWQLEREKDGKVHGKTGICSMQMCEEEKSLGKESAGEPTASLCLRENGQGN
jgi:hypothetical protein